MGYSKKIDGLLSIGEFSNICRASVKQLRYYESIGALKPVHVDPQTNYRYYAPPQIFRVSLLRMCVEEGLPLAELQNYFDETDVLKATEFFERITQLATKRWWREYQTMLRMDSYEHEYERQLMFKAQGSRIYTTEPGVIITTPYEVPIDQFEYGEYNRKITHLIKVADRRDIITLAQQGLFHDDDGSWHVFLQVFDEAGISDKLEDEHDVELIEVGSDLLHVSNVYDTEIDACFMRAIESPVHGRARFIADGWAYTLVTNVYAVNILYEQSGR